MLQLLTARIAPISSENVSHVTVDGEQLMIPYRIHFDSAALATASQLSPAQQQMVGCLCTRHHDGFVRERALPASLRAGVTWTAPYVIQSLGEYVVELTQFLHDQLPVWHTPAIPQFVFENPEFMQRTLDRTVSYWNA